MAEHLQAETLVIGGGPAGALAAALLAQRGMAVTLVERRANAQEKVCGDFLSGEAARPLSRIGIDPQRLGAEPIGGLRVNVGSRTIETALPFTAYGLSRAVLDEAILARAEAYGARILRAVAVKRLEHDGETARWRATCDDDRTIVARRVWLATGKHDLRGHARSSPSSRAWLGLKMPFRLSEESRKRLGAFVELYLFRGFYAGLQALPGRDANLCLAIPKARFTALGGSWDMLLSAMGIDAPRLRERLKGAKPLLLQPLAIAEIPYGYVTSPQETATGLLRLGDQAAVVPSFTGDGVAMALRSAEIAVEALESGDGQQRIVRSHKPIVSRARLIADAALSPFGQSLFRHLLPLAPVLAGEIAKATRVMRI
jgi:flavin-dependent dehydrogenase